MYENTLASVKMDIGTELLSTVLQELPHRRR